YSAVSITHSVPGVNSLSKRKVWQRSASCRDLYDFSFDDTGQAKNKINKTKAVSQSAKLPDMSQGFLVNFDCDRRIDSPVTRYDASHRILFSANASRNASIDVEQNTFKFLSKVFSSSYPGTLNARKREAYAGFEVGGSQDDISHDSYELIERSDDECFMYDRYKDTHVNTRSCSLDSGNYIPSDDDNSGSHIGSDVERQTIPKSKIITYVKYKSDNDMNIQFDPFLMDDPRDLPREKMCVRSDGSFYKEIKRCLDSRTSSQESKSDYHDSKISKSSGDSSKKSGSRTSSQESKSEYHDHKKLNYEYVEISRRRSSVLYDTVKTIPLETISRTSSQESKSEYYDTHSSLQINERSAEGEAEEFKVKSKTQSHEDLTGEFNSKCSKSNFYNIQNPYSTFPSNIKHKETSHVHSISLQNVETEQSMRSYGKITEEKTSSMDSSPKDPDKKYQTMTHIWPEQIVGMNTEIDSRATKSLAYQRQRSSDAENIFSFDKEKIESLTNCHKPDTLLLTDSSKDSDVPLPHKLPAMDSIEYAKSRSHPSVLQSEFDKSTGIDFVKPNARKDTRKEELIAKTHFDEYNPKLILDTSSSSRICDSQMTYTHATVERTKSDPNSLANRQRLGSSRRHVLMHQKSIDLTPADSSDEEYMFRQIPSAPPLSSKYGHFEMPSDIVKPNVDMPKTDFDLPKNYFKEFDDIKAGYKKPTELNKDFEIPYVLHKIHVMNGTAPTPSPKSPKSPKLPKTGESKQFLDAEPQNFLFTQNIDLSKIDPVTLEVDKTALSIHHFSSPKRDITKSIDPALMETLNSKLSQIESDSATSSKTESIQQDKMKYKAHLEAKLNLNASMIQNKEVLLTVGVEKPKTDMKYRNDKPVPAKRIVKPRGQAKKGGAIKTKNKPKTRITSFSSDDESLDSDDVFGSAEATPTRLEFSPPQSRKDIEPILQLEYDKITSGAWHRGQTMSSTEIEGSPPQCRKLVELEAKYHPQVLDPNFASATELRRISERSISIPSSEDDIVTQKRDKLPDAKEKEHSTWEYHLTENIPSPILESCEFLKSDGEEDLADKEVERVTSGDLSYVLKTIDSSKSPNESDMSNSKLGLDDKTLARNKLRDELISPMPRKKGGTPILFAHARLNLSEGSVLALQRQKATQESPTASRRAKSLDTPVISLHKLPPMNAFSSKDDTVGDFDEEGEILEEKSITEKVSPVIEEEIDEDQKAEEVSTPVKRPKELEAVVLDSDELALLDCLTEYRRPRSFKRKPEPRKKISRSPNKSPGKSPNRSPVSKSPLSKSPSRSPCSSLNSPRDSIRKFSDLSENDQIVPDIERIKNKKEKKKPMSKEKMVNKFIEDENLRNIPPPKTFQNKLSAEGQKGLPPKGKSLDKSDPKKIKPLTLTTQKSLPSSLKDRPDFLTVPSMDIKRTKSQELEQIKKAGSKEKSKSIEKMEVRRVNSKERSKSQDESDSEIAKRKEKQQMLFEAALKHTKTLISPVKDALPPFPPPEDKIVVKTEGDKIIIETEIKSKAEDHVFIAKSPKKLDNTLGGIISKSFEDQKTTVKNGKTKGLDEKVSKSFEEYKKDEIESLQKSPKTLSRKQELKQQIEGKVVHKNIKSKSLEKKIDSHAAFENKSKSLDHNFELSAEDTIEDRSMNEVTKADIHHDSDAADEVQDFVINNRKYGVRSPKSRSPIKSTDSEKSDKEEKVVLHGTSLDIWLSVDDDNSAVRDSKDFFNMTYNECISPQPQFDETDMQTIILERRQMDIINKQRQLSESSDKSKGETETSFDSGDHLKEEFDTQLKREDKSCEGISRIISEEESLTEISELKMSDDNSPYVVPVSFVDTESSSENHENDVDLCQKSKNIPVSSKSGYFKDPESSLDTNNSSSCGIPYKNLKQQSTTEDGSLVEFLKHESSTYGFSDLDDSDSVLRNKRKDVNLDLSSCKWKTKVIVTPPQENSPTVENITVLDSKDYLEKVTNFPDSKSNGNNHLNTTSRRHELLKLSNDRSKSSESTSWTSVEKDMSPSGVKDFKGSSVDDESSVSCSIARPMGISQDVEKLNKRDKSKLEELKFSLDYGDDIAMKKSLSSELSPTASLTDFIGPDGQRSPRIIRKSPTPTLEKQGQVDSLKSPSDTDSSSESHHKITEHRVKIIDKGDLKVSSNEPEVILEPCPIPPPLEYRHRKVSKNMKIEITVSQDDQSHQAYIDDNNDHRSKSLDLPSKKKSKENIDGRNLPKTSLEGASKGSLSVEDLKSKTKKGRLRDDQKSSSKSSIDSRGSLSVESRGSFETESSSGSLGAAYRRGDIDKELKPTWRPFLVGSGSEGSSSIEEGWIPPDGEGFDPSLTVKEPYEYSNQRTIDQFHTFSNAKYSSISTGTSKDSSDTEFTDDFNDRPVTCTYVPPNTSISVNTPDLIVNYGSSFAVGRTLSRISERSTNSEKSSGDEDSTKATSHSDSLNDESSDHQASLSSDPPSHTNLAYVSDTDRRTSAEMPDIPIDQGLADKIYEMYTGQTMSDSDPTRKHRFKVERVNESHFFQAMIEKKSRSNDKVDVSNLKANLDYLSNTESQDSDDWPLPELPPKPSESPQARYEAENYSRATKTIFWKGQTAKSVDSDAWPSPPSSLLETPIVENVKTYFMDTKRETAQKVLLTDSNDQNTFEDNHESDDENNTLNDDLDYKDDDKDEFYTKSKSQDKDKESTESPSSRIAPKLYIKPISYEETSYMVEPLHGNEEGLCMKGTVVPNYDRSCLGHTLSSALNIGSCCSQNHSKLQALDVTLSDSVSSNKVIIAQPTKSPQNHSPISEDEVYFNDDVFGTSSKSGISPDTEIALHPFTSHKYSHGSNNSDTSIDDILSQNTNMDELSGLTSRLSVTSCKRCSHSSHSEEETSSLGTDLDGTVKMGVQPKKCTHSSHSEDTSIGLSISEWSTGTNTVRQYANLSASESISGVSNLSGAKSEKSANKSSDFSSNISSNLKSIDNNGKVALHSNTKSSSDNLSFDLNKYDKLCNSETLSSSKKTFDNSSSGTKSDSTLTLAQSISEWSASTSNTLVPTMIEPLDTGAKQVALEEVRVVKHSVDAKASEVSDVQKCKTVVIESYSQSESDKSDKSSSSGQVSDKRYKPHIGPKPILEASDKLVRVPPKSLSYEEKSNKEMPNFSQRCQSEDSAVMDLYQLASPQGEFSGRAHSQLYSQEEKLTLRYQSQDFANFHERQRVMFPVPETKPLTKHSSYDDKTLSKHQIREYKSSQQYRLKTKSRSFHEHLLMSPEGLQGSLMVHPVTQHLTKENVTNLPDNLRAIDRSSKTPLKLSKCSPYYSSSLSSESPPIQTSKTTAKKSILMRNLSMKSPPSGNDTDSSLDLMHDPKERIRSYRRRRQVSTKKIKMEKDKSDLKDSAESSECSEGYIPEIESGSSEMSKTDYQECQRNIDYDENQEAYDDIYAKIPNIGFDEPYPQFEEADQRFRGLDERFPNVEAFTPVYEGFGASADEDEMGYPRFNRHGRLRHPYLDSDNLMEGKVPYSSSNEEKNDDGNYRGENRRSSVKRNKSTKSYMPSSSRASPPYQMESTSHYPQEPDDQRRLSMPEVYNDDDDDNEDVPYHLDTFVYQTKTIKKSPISTKAKHMFTREDSISQFTGYDSPSDRAYESTSYPEGFEYSSSGMFKMQEVYPQYDDYESAETSDAYYPSDRSSMRFPNEPIEYEAGMRSDADHFSRPVYTSEPSFEGSEHSFDVSSIPPPILPEDEEIESKK
ncbi:uncharacterized protein LOC143917487, partial [Arctopsyche grandis]|uniref:uncharacterized protein LOC143917487 n=1 Tax=Arctopsyche grandis TaxID=121162 RepID=UPI00406D8C9B